VLFVHVPKTAGSSIEAAPFVSGDGHMPYWAVSEEIRQTAGFSFAFVRNPYDRFVSTVTEGMYRDMRRDGTEPKTPEEEQAVFEHAKRMIHYAAAQGPSTGELTWGNTETWHVYGQGTDPLPHIDGFAFSVHYVPQHYFLANPGMNGVGIEMVCRFENLNRDWQRVCDRVGVPFELPHKRNSRGIRRQHYSEFYSPEVQDVARRLYRRDFEVFGYDPDVLSPDAD